MLDSVVKSVRPILTETLPYEVPLNFSNEYLFVSELRKDKLPEKIQDFLSKKYRKRLKEDVYTKPFSYSINKGLNKTNTLSIIHPLKQISIARFIDKYSNTILQECSLSESSLRAPHEVLPEITKDELKNIGSVKKLGIPHIAPNDGQLDLNFSPSFFSLRRYNLLDKFYNSNELLRLENKFCLVSTVDVSKCFFNIYTHSITWAVKGKDYSKINSNKFSFEGYFDNLMQKSNYNETNGIVVGPEISRIFAEIILQKIDQNIHAELELHEKINETHYAFRRYVDDYFLFAKDNQTLDLMLHYVQQCLEEYKLFLNVSKTKILQRPFVTNVTRAKQGVDRICRSVIAELEKPLSEDVSNQKETSSSLRSLLIDLRIIISESGSNFSETTGSIYSKISKAAQKLGKRCGEITETTEPDFTKRLRGLLRILFYVIASDFRVAPIYKAYQIIEDLKIMTHSLPNSIQLALQDRIIYEISELLKTYPPEEKEISSGNLSLELCNLILLGNFVATDMMLKQEVFEEILQKLISAKKMNYFAFIAAMYTFGNSDDDKKSHIQKIVKTIEKQIKSQKNEIHRCSELYLLLSDYLSCPFIEPGNKRNIIKEVFQEEGFSDDLLEKLAPHVAFVDWKGARTSHFLRRKRLQPVYYAV